jgi:membrane protein insertase Oxa1/YidC/SpoIIIJ
MLIFFDYLYYGSRKIYSKYESGAGFHAIVLIALTQVLNIFTVYLIYCVIAETRVNMNKLTFLALYFSVLILNVVRYSKLDPELIKEKWENKKEKQKITMRALLVIYIFLSFALSIGLAIYIGNRDN